MKCLTIDDILSSDDITIERVECPEWGGVVFIRTITADKRDKFENDFNKSGAGMLGVRARLVSACMCDEKGKPSGISDAQIKALGKKSSAVMDRIFTRCMIINGMRDEDVEEMEKNYSKAEESVSG